MTIASLTWDKIGSTVNADAVPVEYAGAVEPSPDANGKAHAATWARKGESCLTEV